MKPKEKVSILGASLKDIKAELQELEKSLNGLTVGTEEYESAVQQLVDTNREYTNAVNEARGKNEALEGSYAAIQAEMKILREAWRGVNDESVRIDLGQRINTLNDELKSLDSTIGDSYRNVGSYSDALEPIGDKMDSIAEDIKPVAQRLGELEDAMRQMLANGVSPLDEGFQELAKEAGNLKNAQDSVAKIIEQNALATSKFNDAISVMTTGTSILGAYEGAMAALGVENENVAQTIAKLNGLMTVLNSLQAINQELANKSSATYKIFHGVLGWINKDTKAVSAAMAQGGTAITSMSRATKLMNGALKVTRATLASLGIPALIMLLVGLVTNIDKIWNTVKNLTQGVPVLGGVFSAIGKTVDFLTDKFKALSEWFGKVSEDKNKVAFEAQVKLIEDMAKATERNVNELKAKGATEKEILEYQRQQNIKIREQIGLAEKMRGADKERVEELKKENREQAEQLQNEKTLLYYSEQKKKNESSKTAVDTAKAKTEAQKAELEILKNLIAERKEANENTIEAYRRETELLKAQGITAEEVYKRENALLEIQRGATDTLITLLEDKASIYSSNKDAVAWIEGELKNLNRELANTEFDIKLSAVVNKAEVREGALDSLRNQLETNLDEALSKSDFTRRMIDGLEGVEQVDALKAQLDYEYRLYMDYYDNLDRLAQSDEERANIRRQREALDREHEAESLDLSKRRLEALSEEAEKTANNVMASADAVGNLMGTVASMMEDEINRKLESGKIDEKQAKEAFERVKKLQLAEVWINTLSGVANAYMSAMKLGAFVGPIVGAANAAAAMAFGVAQHRQIKATQFGGGGGGSQTAGGLQMMAVAPVADTTQAANEMTALNIQGGKQDDIKVYILESDIEDTMKRVSVREQETTFP